MISEGNKTRKQKLIPSHSLDRFVIAAGSKVCETPAVTYTKDYHNNCFNWIIIERDLCTIIKLVAPLPTSIKQNDWTKNMDCEHGPTILTLPRVTVPQSASHPAKTVSEEKGVMGRL